MGHSRIVSTHDTPIEGHYLLSRAPDEDGNQVYRAGLNLVFVPADGATEEDAREMRRRTQECYSDAKPFLKSGEGTRIELELLDPKAGPKLPPAVEVRVSRELDRPSQFHWGLNQECALTIHESFHHLGLVDEYVNNPIDGDEFDCRRAGPRGSIMKNGLSDTELFGVQQQVSCNCDREAKDHEECEAALRSIKGIPRECPAHSVPRIDWAAIGIRRDDLRRQRALDDLQWNLLVKGGPESEDKYVFLWSKPFAGGREGAPPLLPAHVRSIVYPGCKSKNAVYYECASLAYRSSNGDPAACEGQKHPACADGSLEWLLN